MAAFSRFSSSEVVVVDIFCLFGSGCSASIGGGCGGGGGGGELSAMFMEDRQRVETLVKP